jgi:uncharacterized delta-60 repeat protein
MNTACRIVALSAVMVSRKIMSFAKRNPVLERPALPAALRLLTATLLAATAAAFAGPGDLDASFGEGGRVFVDIPDDTDVAATLIIQADGKLVVGRGNEAVDDDFSVLRLNVDGSLDPSFDGDGRTSLDYPGVKGITHVVLQQTDGKIIAAGSSRNSSGSDGTDFGLARFNKDGSVDTSFGVGGVVIHDLGGDYEGIDTVVQQDDGRLVAAGYANSAGDVSNRDMAFARFNTDGTLDRLFGINGSTIVNFHDSNGPDWVRWLAQQADGSLIAAGTAWPSNPSSSSDAAVVRLNPDGLPDATFDVDGLATVDFYATRHDWGGWFIEGAAAGLQPDGKLAVVGITTYTVWDYGNYCVPMLARLNADSSLDASFGDGGSVQYLFDYCTDVQGMVIAPNGDFFLAGGQWISGRYPMVAHITPDGNPDLAYGVNGVSVIDVGKGNKAAHALYGSQGVVQQPDGKIVVVASTSSTEWESGDAVLVVARLVVNGESPGVLGLQALSDIAEASGEVAVAVLRTGGASGAASIDYETLGGTATSGVDFSPGAGTLTWNDGDVTAKTISIGIADDSEIEGSEDFQLILYNPSGGVSLATTAMTFRIEDDDSGEAPNPLPPASPPASSGGSGAIDWASLFVLALLTVAWRSVAKRQVRNSFLVATPTPSER